MNEQGYTVSVRYDPCGGAFAGTENVQVIDVFKLEDAKRDSSGNYLINLITPMVRATPIQSIMTDDLGILHDGESCSCGIRSPWLEIVGRVGLKDIKTCAAGAGDILAASLGKEEHA
jgi:hypothetical protein